MKGFKQKFDGHAKNSIEKTYSRLNVTYKHLKSSGPSRNQTIQKNWKNKGKKWDNKSNFVYKQTTTQDKTKFALWKMLV